MSSRLPSRLLVLALAAWKSIGRRRPPSLPRRILVAHHLLLGDTLMLTPLLAKLREQWPQAEIVMTVPKAIAPLYQKHPYGVLAVPYDPCDGGTLHQLLRLAGFDLAIIPGDNRHSWLARALGAKWVVAFSDDKPAWKNWPVDEAVPYPAHPAAWGDMVAGLVEGAPPAPYHPGDWQAPDCKPFAPPQPPCCILHLGASSPLKLWPADRWQALAEHLARKGYEVAWSGGPGEQDLVTAVDPEGRFRSFAGKLDLPQLWHLIGGAHLLVCPDTGIAHLGRILGTPTVTLFGPGSPDICGAGNFWRDMPYRAVTVADFFCRDQQVLFRRRLPWVRRCGRGTRECAAAHCMEAIGVEEVIRAAEEILPAKALTEATT